MTFVTSHHITSHHITSQCAGKRPLSQKNLVSTGFLGGGAYFPLWREIMENQPKSLLPEDPDDALDRTLTEGFDYEPSDEEEEEQEGEE
jgi:hypothetical protein